MQPNSVFHGSRITLDRTARSHILCILILAGILSLTSVNPAIACSEVSQVSQRQTNNRDNRLPQQVENAVRRHLSRQTSVAPGQLRITQSSRQTWSDGCLGIPEPDQFCTQALVEGWRVVVSNQGQTWVYRTNASGSVVKPEQTTNPRN